MRNRTFIIIIVAILAVLGTAVLIGGANEVTAQGSEREWAETDGSNLETAVLPPQSEHVSAPSYNQTCLTATADTYVKSGDPNANFGTETSMDVGDTSYGVRRSFLRFDLASIPVGATVISATLDTYLIYAGDSMTATLHTPGGPWGETSLTWETQPLVGPSYAQQTYNYGAIQEWTQWEVSDLAQQWVSGKWVNYGVVISPTAPSFDFVSYGTRERTDDTAPQLCLAWRPPTRLSDVPIEHYRRAAQFLEDQRFGPMAPEWGGSAQLASIVQPFYRPDVEGVAYYEFAVVRPAMRKQSAQPNESPLGYILVATGEHDYPIAHWNYTGAPISGQLEAIAQARESTAAKFYKLDALAYSAEDGAGDLVANWGTQLVKVTGQDPAWLDEPVELTEETWTLDEETADDTNAAQISGTLTTTGPAPPESLQLEAWSSWDELKSDYTQSYGVMLEALRRDAQEEWEIMGAMDRYGVSLEKGDTYSLTLLSNGQPSISLDGAGADYVDTALVDRSDASSLFRITAVDDIAGEEIPFTVTVDYAEVLPTEQVNFAVVDPLSSVWLPVVIGGDASAGAQSDVNRPQATQASWGNWNVYWAGTHGDQRLYEQLEPYESPNPESCYTGCGATAWAMLFGWADKQAADGNPYWQPRWGLYRQDGGRGSNAVAPRNMSQGVKNITWELRQQTNGWCTGFQQMGATFPWEMYKAYQYLSGRTGTRLATHYNTTGVPEARLRTFVRNSIIHRNTPAILGTGWLRHYPMAYGYAWRSRRVKACPLCFWKITQYQRSFYANQGWGDVDENGWIPARTWFAGEIYP